MIVITPFLTSKNSNLPIDKDDKRQKNKHFDFALFIYLYNNCVHA